MARRPVVLVSALLLAGLLALLFAAPPGPRSLKTFDPDRVADLEVDMWQAYYNKERVRLFRGLLTLLREQNRYSWARAGQQAELAWWVARRVPDQSDPANVGRLMAQVNASIYGVPAERVLRASELRAEAGALLDRGGAKADWNAVSTLLHSSYRQLHRSVQ